MYKIILVEDEAPLLRTMKRSIENLNMQFNIVAMETNGIHALKQCKLLQPDILMTDINMPAMSGLQLIELALKEQPSLTPIIVSGYQDFHYAHQAIRLNVRDYLLKPLQEEQLMILMKKITAELDQRQKVKPQPTDYAELNLPNDENRRLISQVAEYINVHYSEALTVSNLADRFAISHSQLTRLFKHFFGLTPIEYIIDTRIKIAKKLFQTQPELRIKEIAALVGYEDHHYFSRLFTQLNEMSPSIYRKTGCDAIKARFVEE